MILYAISSTEAEVTDKLPASCLYGGETREIVTAWDVYLTPYTNTTQLCVTYFANGVTMKETLLTVSKASFLLALHRALTRHTPSHQKLLPASTSVKASACALHCNHHTV